MKVVSALLVIFACTAYVFADSCGKDGEECLEALYQAFSDSVGTIIDCRNMKASISCLEDVSDRCLTGEEKENTDGQIYKLRRDVDGICPGRSHGYYRHISDNQVLECLGNKNRLYPYIEECTEQISRDATSGLLKLPSSTRDTKCRIFMATARCISAKLGDVCGEPVEKPFISAMVIQLKNGEPNVAKSVECAEGIRKAEEYFKEKLDF